MHRAHNPSTAPKSFSRYAQAVEVDENRRWLYISGQVGVDLSGRLADDIDGQMELAWQNVLELLKAAEMNAQHLVKVTGYLIRPEHTAVYRRVRDQLLEGAAPASTLVIVKALAHPDWLVEIEAVAAA